MFPIHPFFPSFVPSLRHLDASVISESVKWFIWRLKLLSSKALRNKIPRTAELATNVQLLRNIFFVFFIVVGVLACNDLYEIRSGKWFALGYVAPVRGSANPEKDIFHNRFLLSEP